MTFKEYQKKVNYITKIAFKKIKPYEEAQDIAQELMIEVWKENRIFANETHWKRWMTKAVRWRVHDKISSIKQWLNRTINYETNQKDRGKKYYNDRLKYVELKEAIDGKLPKNCQDIILLKWQGYKFKDIGPKVGLTSRTAERYWIGTCKPFLRFLYGGDHDSL